MVLGPKFKKSCGPMLVFTTSFVKEHPLMGLFLKLSALRTYLWALGTAHDGGGGGRRANDPGAHAFLGAH